MLKLAIALLNLSISHCQLVSESKQGTNRCLYFWTRNYLSNHSAFNFFKTKPLCDLKSEIESSMNLGGTLDCFTIFAMGSFFNKFC